MEDRNNIIDILKGIGIISIVIGHSSLQLNIFNYTFEIAKFVYLYHLVVFFFVGGILFKEKYAFMPYAYVGKKVKSLYIPFVKVCTILLLLRPIMYKLNLFETTYNKIEYIQFFCNILLFQCFGEISSALWFVPVYFFSLIIFCFILYLEYKLRFSKIWGAIWSILIGISGIYLIEKGCQFLYRLEIAFLVVPIIYLGFIFRKYGDKLIEYCFFSLSIIIGIILYLYMISTGKEIDLSSGKIFSPTLFYFISILGIYMCISIAKYITNFKKLSKVLEIIGRNSFYIIAFHLFFSKLIDWVYVSITQSHYEQLYNFPRGPQVLYIFYWTINIIAPIGVVKLYHKIKESYTNKIFNLL